MNRQSTWAASLAAAGVLGCSPALNWREVRPEGAALVALMPCKPSSYARSVQLAGAAVQLSLQACSAEGLTWAVAHADLGDASRVPAALAELKASAAANLGAAAPTMLPLVLDGAPTGSTVSRFELIGRLPDGKAVVEQVALLGWGSRVVQVTVLGPSLPVEHVDTFFSGLRLGR